MQSALFSLANVIIQKYINAFQADTIAANTAAHQIDNIVYTIGNAVALSCMAFVSQNYGKGEIKRVKKVLLTSMLMAIIATVFVSALILLLADPLLDVIVDTEIIKEYAKIRLTVLCSTYFLCSVMECLSYTMRALGKSIPSMIICLIGACGLRLLWMKTIFGLNPTRYMLYLAWPVSWVITVAIYLCIVMPMLNKLIKEQKNKEE